MRRWVCIVATVAAVAVTLVVPVRAAGRQSSDCLMLGWTGLQVETNELMWRGDVEQVDATPVRSLDGVGAFGWSPDGSRFAAVVSPYDSPVLHIGAEPPGADVEVPDVGGERLAWAPGGDRVLLSGPGDGTVTVVDTSGAVVTLDDAGRNASWSADGAWIAWSSGDGVQIARPDGSAASILAGPPANGALWRPGGHQLLILAPSFLLADADTHVLVPLTLSPLDFAKGFAWSPDGSALAWSASEDGTAPPRVWVDRFDGTGAHAVSPLLPSTTAPGTFEPFLAPFWSPDGSQLAVGEAQGPWSTGFTGGSLRVRVLPADGSSEGTPLGDFPEPGNVFTVGDLVSVQWSPDGEWLAVGVRRTGVVGGSSATGVGYSVTAVDGSSSRDIGGSFRVEGHADWWPVVGVVGADGGCVLPTAADEPGGTAPSAQPATSPKFTG